MRRHSNWGSVFLALLIVPCVSGCLMVAGRHWDEVRGGVIEPINSALHSHLPRDIRAKDLPAILALYATDTGGGLVWDDPIEVTEEFEERRLRWVGSGGSEPIRERYEALLAWFDTVEKADLRIHRVYWEERDARGYPADVHLIVRGLAEDGERRVVDQWARVWLGQEAGRWVVTAEDVTFRELISTAAPRFEAATDTAGMKDTHDISGSPQFRLIGELAASSGAAVGDFDCDGFEDVALLSTTRLALYRNAANGTFTDVTAAFGLSERLDIAGTGLVFFDADNDGDPDLWVCGIRGERFYRNQGCAALVDESAVVGVKPSVWSSMPIVADYDRDGLLDVYVIRMGDHERTAPRPNWNARNGVADTLYRNTGTAFEDVTAAAGIEETGWGLAGAWGDYNNDLYPDILVGNEFGFKSLYRNDGDGTFTEVAEPAGALDRGAAMGIAWGDYDGDGHLDAYINNMYANSRWALFHPEFPPPIPWYLTWIPRDDVEEIIEENTRGSTLLRNNGDGTFADVSAAAGVRDGQWGWGAEFLDYNNDGRLDILASNGFVTGPLLDDI